VELIELHTSYSGHLYKKKIDLRKEKKKKKEEGLEISSFLFLYQKNIFTIVFPQVGRL
jgi:hypothetical protein